MPRFNSFGGASARAWRAGGIVATFVMAAAVDTTGALTNNIPWAGCVAGDVGVIDVTYADATAAPAGWATLVSEVVWPYGYKQQVYWKVLSAGDIAAGTTVNYTNAAGIILNFAYRNASAVTVGNAVSYTVNPSSANVMPGFAKPANPRLIVSYCIDRDRTNTDTIPPNWVKRLANVAGTGFFTATVADIPPDSYPSNSTVTWSNGPSTLGTACQMLVFS